MGRKTNNSSQMLSLAAQAFAVVESDAGNSTNNSNPNNNKATHAPKIAKRRNTTQSSSSEDADAQEDEDSSEEADDEEDEDGEPAGFAPSVRATIEDGEQAGLPTGGVVIGADVTAAKQNMKSKKTERSAFSSRHTSQTGDDSEFNYEDVNNISDSSDVGKPGDSDDDDDDPKLDEFEAKAVIPNASEWDLTDFDDLDAGMLGQADDFFYQTGSSIMASDDYQTNLGPTEGSSPPPAPTPSSQPSPRRVRFASEPEPNTVADLFPEFRSARATAGETNEEEHAGKSDLDNGGSTSGYESGSYIHSSPFITDHVCLQLMTEIPLTIAAPLKV